MPSRKRLVSELAPVAWPLTRWLIQVGGQPETWDAIYSVMKSPITRKVMHGFAVVGREVTVVLANSAAERSRYYPPQYYPPRPSTYSEGSDMTFGRASRDPALRNLQNITRNLSETADELLEEQEEKRRFDALPEFVVREVREVRVKAASKDDAIEIAKVAFKHGQDEDHHIDRDHLSWNRFKGDTIDKIRRVSIKAGKYFD